LLQFKNRPLWQTVQGGSRVYVEALVRDGAFEIARRTKIISVARNVSGVQLIGADGRPRTFDQVVIATHADQALDMLTAPTTDEARLLKDFSYQSNRAVLHRDPRFMPKRKSVWASWNYCQASKQNGDQKPCVTYWMNSLQNLNTTEQLFVTLNPEREINEAFVAGVFDYTHPLFSAATRRAQARLWQLQGQNRTWFCGSYFGHGFHEDGLQSGLAVAEQLGGVRRPWNVENESGRIFLSASDAQAKAAS